MFLRHCIILAEHSSIQVHIYPNRSRRGCGSVSYLLSADFAYVWREGPRF